jgi:histidine triad (HIT) family protein
MVNLYNIKRINEYMEECIFCKIVRGEIPSEKVGETENFLAIKDIYPKTPGHTLILPKKHYQDFRDIPAELYGEMMTFARDTADKILIEQSATDFNLLMNNGPTAGQVVWHAHLHIIPRKQGQQQVLEGNTNQQNNTNTQP